MKGSAVLCSQNLEWFVTRPLSRRHSGYFVCFQPCEFWAFDGVFCPMKSFAKWRTLFNLVPRVDPGNEVFEMCKTTTSLLTRIGTVKHFQGKFSLPHPSSGTSQISYIGQASYCSSGNTSRIVGERETVT